jgi:hypothetical protein
MAKKGKSQALPKDKKVAKPHREPDMTSKRGVPYWFDPEWVRDLNGTIGRIAPIKAGQSVDLYMVSKDGNETYIAGSIQEEFQAWHLDREIDFILLGMELGDLKVEWDLVDNK